MQAHSQRCCCAVQPAPSATLACHPPTVSSIKRWRARTVVSSVAAPYASATTGLPEPLEAFSSMLATYRDLQRRLSPEAVHAVRSLGTHVPTSSDYTLLLSRPEQEAWLAQVAARTGASLQDLRELRDVRRRLLHDVKHLKERVASSGGSGSLSSKLRAAAATRATCNSLAPEQAAMEAGGGAAGQWVRAKQYRQRRSKQVPNSTSSSSTPTPQQQPLALANTTHPSWISRLGFADMVQHEEEEEEEEDEEGLQAEALQPQMLAGLGALPLLEVVASARVPAAAGGDQGMTQGQEQQQGEEQAGVMATATVAGQQHHHHQQQRAEPPATGTGPDAAMAATAQPPPAPPPLSLPQGGHQQHSPQLQQVAVHTSHAPHVHGAAAAAPPHEMPAGAPSRLRNALVRAQQYKQQGPQDSSSSTNGSRLAESLPQPPPAYANVDPNVVLVERAAFDVYAAPRRSRANPEEEALLVPP